MFKKLSALLSGNYFLVSKIFVALLVALGSTFVYLGGGLDQFENVTLDQRFKVRPRLFTFPKLIIVEIAEDSIKHVGRWPWDREWHATIVKALTEFGARGIAFDVLFSEPSTEEGDRLFAKTLSHAGNVYLPVAFSETEQGRGKGLVRSIPVLSDAAKGEGHITITPDDDGLLRRMRLRIRHEGKDYVQLGFKMALDHFGVRSEDVVYKKGAVEVPIPNNPVLRIPVEDEDQIIINWAGTWKESFVHVSFIDVIVSYAQWLKGKETRIPVDIFENALCMIGVTATGLFDIRSIPIEAAYPAVGVNVNLLNSVLEKSFLRAWGAGPNLAVLWGLSFIILIIMLRCGYLLSIILIVTVAMAYIALSVGLFIFADLITSIVYPLFLIFFSYLGLTVYHQIVVSFEKQRLMRLATKDSMTGLFNIGHFKLLLGAEIKSLELRRNHSLSIVMIDIDFFKKINDTYGHAAGDEVLKALSDILRNGCRALDVAARYGGEEFILMLPGTAGQDAITVAEKIRKNLASREFHLGQDKVLVRVTGSFGVADYGKGESIDTFMKRADQALYQAKEGGRDQVRRSST